MPLFVAPFSITIWGKSTLLSTLAERIGARINQVLERPLAIVVSKTVVDGLVSY